MPSSVRQQAKIQPLLTGSKLNPGFWGDRLELARTTTIPNMWKSLSDPAISSGWENFLVAAGDIEGVHGGPPYLDGDIYKWFEAAASLLQTESDPHLDALLTEVAQMIAKVQRDDGYLHTPTLIAARAENHDSELADRFAFETYNIGHLITAMVRRYDENGDQNCLNIATHAAEFLEKLARDDEDTLARSAICPSHYMAVIDLYRATGDNKYLDLSQRFLEVRENFQGGDDNQDRVSVYEQDKIVGHSVRANYLYAGLADLLLESHDSKLLDVLSKVWDDAASSKIYITGGCGALYDGASPFAFPEQTEISRVHQAYGHPYQLPNTTAHNESCANVGMMLWSERMLALTGEAKYADMIETVAYNALLGSISLDGKKYFYTNPLRQVRDLTFPLRMPGDTGLSPVPMPPPSNERMRAEYMSVFCCPPNIARTLTQFHEQVAGYKSDGIWVYQYTSATLTAPLTNGDLQLSVVTDYPWDENIRIQIEKAPKGEASINLRIPAWCEGGEVTINEGSAEPVSRGFAALSRQWSVGDTITLTLPMPPRVIRSHRLAEELVNQVAVQRGPVVYCLESPDLDPDTKIEQVAIHRGNTFSEQTIQIDDYEVVALDTTAVVLPLSSEDDLYSTVSNADLQSTQIRLIPYFAWGNRGPSEMSVWLPLAW